MFAGEIGLHRTMHRFFQFDRVIQMNRSSLLIAQAAQAVRKLFGQRGRQACSTELVSIIADRSSQGLQRAGIARDLPAIASSRTRGLTLGLAAGLQGGDGKLLGTQ